MRGKTDGFLVRALVAGLLLAPPLETRAAARPAGGTLDLERWLTAPGVRLVAVELYATWCAPCMAAVPRWQELQRRHKADGLRVVVVATQDPAGCATPGWTPDAVVCDAGGAIAKRLGSVDKLPAAFLWSWQGALLVERGHMTEVEGAVEAWLRKAPRVVLEVPPGSGSHGAALRDLVREALDREDKLVVVASAEEKKLLDRIRARSFSTAYDERLQCDLGKAVSANSALQVRVAERRLHLTMLDAETGCLVASSFAPWRTKAPGTSAREAVRALLERLRRGAEMPKGSEAPAPVAERPASVPERPAGVQATFASEPAGAEVLVDGRRVCTTEPGGCSASVETGLHDVRMRKDGFREHAERVALDEGSILSWNLEAGAGPAAQRPPPPPTPLPSPPHTTPLRGPDLRAIRERWRERLQPAVVAEVIASLEDLAEREPGDPAALLLLAEAHQFRADTHPGDRDYLAGMDRSQAAALRALALLDPELVELWRHGKTADVVTRAGALVESKEALYWLARSVVHGGQRMSAANARPLVERLAAVDRRFQHGGPHRLLGELASLEGDFDAAQAHFERSVLVAPSYQATKVLLAEKVALPRRDRAYFERLLHEVVKAPENVLPDFEPETALAKARARDLLGRGDRLFPR